MANGYSLTDLQRLVRDAGITEREPPPKLQSLVGAPPRNFKSAADEQRAEQILLEQINSGVERKPSVLTSKFSKRRLSSYNFKNATAALLKAAEQETAGVVQALLEKGGSMENIKNSETKGAQTEERSQLLLIAVRAAQEDTVSVLAPLSPKPLQIKALAESLALGHTAIASRLLQENVDPNHCRAQFNAAVSCANTSLVSLLLQAPNHIKNATLIDSLTTAVTMGSLEIVKLLVDAADLSHEQELPAVEVAVKAGQPDPLLVILSHAPGLSSAFLDRLILEVFECNATTVDAQTKMFDALFYAGAHGDKSAATFVLAIEQQPRFVDLFAKHHVDINWADAKAVRRASKDGDSNLVRRVIGSGGLRARPAAEALRQLPRNIPAAPRVEIMRMLLEAKPQGPAVDDQLVFAVEDQLEDAVIMLRNYGASLDHNDGAALIRAIKLQHIATVRHLLARAVDPETLARAFPHLQRVDKPSRRLMTRMLLEAKASGAEVHAALRDAVCDRCQDAELIDLLINGGADPTYQDSQSLRHAIATENVELLRKLLRCPASVSSKAVSALVGDVMRCENANVRKEMLQDAIEAEADEESLSRTLCLELSNTQYDNSIVELLVNRGNADANFKDGKPLSLAAQHSNDMALRLFMGSPRVFRTSRHTAVKSLLQSKLTESEKAARLPSIIDVRDCETIVFAGLKAQLDYCRSNYVHGRQWPMEIFRVLLDARPNLELDGGDIVATVVRSAALPLLSTIIKPRLSQPIIKVVLMQALTIGDEKDRHDVCEAILMTKPAQDTVSAALEVASEKRQTDVCEMLLKSNAMVDYNDHTSIRHAASRGDLQLLNIILSAKPPLESLAAAFYEAKSLQPADTRLEALRRILEAGFRGPEIDQHLVAIIESEGCDLRLVQLLLENEASVEAYDCQSITFAATHGYMDLLLLLWSNVAQSDTSTRCFEACLGAGLVQGNRVDVLRFLLDRGARGPSLDQALLMAVDTLANNPLPLDMINLLLSFGANSNFEDGRPLCRACELGRVDVVEALVLSGSTIRARSKALHNSLKSDPQHLPNGEFCKTIDILTAPKPWDPGYPHQNEIPKFSTVQQDFPSAIHVLLANRPEGVQELTKVLKAGCKVSSRSDPALLEWAINHTTPKISAQCIQILLEHGANAKFVSGDTGESLIMMAVRTRKPSLIKPLVSNHGDVSQKDKQGRSPLLVAVQMSDWKIVSELLKAAPAKNDGSLHQAVRNLNLGIMKMLLEAGHDATLPSPYHGRRTPLKELLYHVEATAANLAKTGDVIYLLQQNGVDMTKPILEKPVICVALDQGPYMAEAFLRACLSKCIDEDFNLYWLDRFCYSPTMYVREKLCQGPEHQLDEKWDILKAYGASRDVFYARRGRQPPHAVGVPEELRRAEWLAQQREQQEAEDEAKHLTELRRTRELAQEKAMANQAELRQQIENQRALEREQQALLKSRHDLERAFNKEKWTDEQNRELEQRRLLQHDREQELNHQTAQAQVTLSYQKQTLNAQQEHHKQLKHYDYLAKEKETKLQRSLAQDQDKYQDKQHQRRMKELAMESAIPVGRPLRLDGPISDSQRVIEYR